MKHSVPPAGLEARTMSTQAMNEYDDLRDCRDGCKLCGSLTDIRENGT